MPYTKGSMEKRYRNISKELDKLGDAYSDRDGVDHRKVGLAYKELADEVRALGDDIEESYEELRKDVTIIARGMELHFQYLKNLNIRDLFSSLYDKLLTQLKHHRLGNSDYK